MPKRKCEINVDVDGGNLWDEIKEGFTKYTIPAFKKTLKVFGTVAPFLGPVGMAMGAVTQGVNKAIGGKKGKVPATTSVAIKRPRKAKAPKPKPEPKPPTNKGTPATSHKGTPATGKRGRRLRFSEQLIPAMRVNQGRVEEKKSNYHYEVVEGRRTRVYDYKNPKQETAPKSTQRQERKARYSSQAGNPLGQYRGESNMPNTATSRKRGVPVDEERMGVRNWMNYGLPERMAGMSSMLTSPSVFSYYGGPGTIPGHLTGLTQKEADKYVPAIGGQPQTLPVIPAGQRETPPTSAPGVTSGAPEAETGTASEEPKRKGKPPKTEPEWVSELSPMANAAQFAAKQNLFAKIERAGTIGKPLEGWAKLLNAYFDLQPSERIPIRLIRELVKTYVKAYELLPERLGHLKLSEREMRQREDQWFEGSLDFFLNPKDKMIEDLIRQDKQLPGEFLIDGLNQLMQDFIDAPQATTVQEAESESSAKLSESAKSSSRRTSMATLSADEEAEEAEENYGVESEAEGGVDPTAFVRAVPEYAPPELANLIKTWGDANIFRIRICRVPLQKPLEVLGNLVTAGKLNAAKRTLNYDNYFHLYIEMSLRREDGSASHVLVEKNQRVNVRTTPGGTVDKCINVPMSKPINLGEFFANAESKTGKNQLYVYDAVNQNCQVFVRDVLASNGLWNPRMGPFVLQNVAAAVTPLVQKLMRGVTDFAAKFDRFLKGKGRPTM
jgi:hypothetical protein